MRRNSKGFTLVELLVTVVLLGVVATIVVVNMTGISKQGQDREYEAFRQAVISAATAYSASNDDVFANLYIDKAYMYISGLEILRISISILAYNINNAHPNDPSIPPWLKNAKAVSPI